MSEVTKEVDHQKEIIKLIKQAAYNKAIYEVFNDFLEIAAISISNSVDFTHREEREKRYLDLINSYDKRRQELFPHMFAHLVEALEEKAQTTGPEDVLGPIYHELELHNKYKGQFFTPQHVSDMMAMITCGADDYQGEIAEQGYISMCEPTCGSGVMVTSMCKAMTKVNLNYCTQLVVTAVDIDLKCVHMTYLQLALYGVPAVVIHGDSIAIKEWSRWYTPVYLLYGWVWRAHCGLTSARSREDEMIKCALEPTYAAMCQVEKLIGEPLSNSSEPVQKSGIVDETMTAGSAEEVRFDVDFGRAQTPDLGVLKARRGKAAPPVDVCQITLFEGDE